MVREEGADHQPCIDDASGLDKMAPEGQEEGVQWAEAQEAHHELGSLIRAEQLTL